MLLALAGCGPSTRLAEVALDYHIDRPRVVALRFDPPYAQPGQPVTVEALALAPRGTVIDGLTASSCVPDPLAETTSYRDLSCFREPELTEALGAVPATWTPPRPTCEAGTEPTPYEGTWYDYEETGDTGYGYYYYDSGCNSTYPVLVEARTSEGSGYGYVFVDVYDSDPLTATQPSMWSLEQSLTASEDVRPGRDVELEYTIATPFASPTYPGFHWYVDAGVLLRTGVTSPSVLTEESTTTRNTLRIPDDWHGPLRVVVVAVRDGGDNAGADTTWRVVVLDVP